MVKVSVTAKGEKNRINIDVFTQKMHSNRRFEYIWSDVMWGGGVIIVTFSRLNRVQVQDI